MLNLFTHATANPDVLGQVRITADDIPQEQRDAHESKLRRARQYLAERNLTIRPIIRARGEQ